MFLLLIDRQLNEREIGGVYYDWQRESPALICNPPVTRVDTKYLLLIIMTLHFLKIDFFVLWSKGRLDQALFCRKSCNEFQYYVELSQTQLPWNLIVLCNTTFSYNSILLHDIAQCVVSPYVRNYDIFTWDLIWYRPVSCNMISSYVLLQDIFLCYATWYPSMLCKMIISCIK